MLCARVCACDAGRCWVLRGAGAGADWGRGGGGRTQGRATGVVSGGSVGRSVALANRHSAAGGGSACHALLQRASEARAKRLEAVCLCRLRSSGALLQWVTPRGSQHRLPRSCSPASPPPPPPTPSHRSPPHTHTRTRTHSPRRYHPYRVYGRKDWKEDADADAATAAAPAAPGHTPAAYLAAAVARTLSGGRFGGAHRAPAAAAGHTAATATGGHAHPPAPAAARTVSSSGTSAAAARTVSSSGASGGAARTVSSSGASGGAARTVSSSGASGGAHRATAGGPQQQQLPAYHMRTYGVALRQGVMLALTPPGDWHGEAGSWTAAAAEAAAEAAGAGSDEVRNGSLGWGGARARRAGSGYLLMCAFQLRVKQRFWVKQRVG